MPLNFSYNFKCLRPTLHPLGRVGVGLCGAIRTPAVLAKGATFALLKVAPLIYWTKLSGIPSQG